VGAPGPHPLPSGRKVPSLEGLFVAAFTLLGLRLGLRPLGDNSLFVHLRTGIDLLHTHHVPTRDTYSFSAPGHRWVVQSWLAELTYGAAHRVGGFPAVRIEQGLLYGLAAWLVTSLARAGSALRTALAAGLAIGMGVAYWSPRPLVFGVLGMALLVWVVRRRLPPWLLVPIAWAWVNTHGSFVLGLAWLALVAVGQRLDGDRRPVVLPWLAWFVVGLAVACLNPLGPRLLLFPLAVLSKHDAFAKVLEWRSPTFSSGPGLLTLACLVGLVIVLARARSRLRWAELLPVVAFLGAGLQAQRNLPMLAVVAAPVLAVALRRPDEAPSSLAVPEDRVRLHLALGGVLAALTVVFLVVAAIGPALDLGGYPEAAAALVPHGARVATTDIGGCFFELARRDVTVLTDDRVDMYPSQVTRDYLRLLGGKPGGLDLLDRYGADTVVWQVDSPLTVELAASDRWREIGRPGGWAVFVRSA